MFVSLLSSYLTRRLERELIGSTGRCNRRVYDSDLCEEGYGGTEGMDR